MRAPSRPTPTPATTGPRPDDGIGPALAVILGGVAAALHVGKLPPAIATLQLALGLAVVQAGFLVSLMQLAGMVFGLAFGVLADGIGARRSMVLGLTVLAAASALGAAANGVAPLMLLRAAEGFGFLLAVLPAPGLVRRLVAPRRVNAMLGLWGAYMPLATALALLAGPLAIAALGWRGWWWLLTAASLAMALWLAAAVPAAPGEARPGPAATAGTIGTAGGVHMAGMAGMAGTAGMVGTAGHAGAAATPLTWRMRLARTLVARGPRLVALRFWLYSGQWLAVIGFLPASQFATPPLAAWVAMRAGGWHFTRIVTGSCGVLGLLLRLAIARRLRAGSRMHTPHAS
jgi:MFS family permease